MPSVRPLTVALVDVEATVEAIRAALRDWPAAIKATWGALVLYALAAAVAARYGGSPFTAPLATIARRP